VLKVLLKYFHLKLGENKSIFAFIMHDLLRARMWAYL